MAESATGGGWLDGSEPRPWGWLAVFFALTVLLLGGMLAWWAIFGFWNTLFDPNEPLGISFDGRSHLTLAVLLAFVFSGTRWLRGGTLRDIQQLGELAGATPTEIEEAQRRNSASPPAVRAVAFAAAILLGTTIIRLTGGLNLFSAEDWDMHHVWAVANNIAIFFLMFDGAWLSMEGWRTLAHFTRSRVSIDLLDRTLLASIGRSGLRGAAIWLGGCTIASFLTWGVYRITPLLVIFSIPLTLATVSLLLPAAIARGRLRAEKRAELVRVRAKISDARDAVFSGSGGRASEQAALLPGLLAYEARIESVREWPYDAPTLVRFALLAVIAASSWLGGALVERAVGAVLD